MTQVQRDYEDNRLFKYIIFLFLGRDRAGPNEKL